MGGGLGGLGGEKIQSNRSEPGGAWEEDGTPRSFFRERKTERDREKERERSFY